MLPFPFFVKERDLDGVVSLDVRKDVRKREAIVPESEPTPAFPDDGGVDKGTDVVEIEVDDFLS